MSGPTRGMGVHLTPALRTTARVALTSDRRSARWQWFVPGSSIQLPTSNFQTMYDDGMLSTATCAVCGRESPLIAAHLGVCGQCVREQPAKALPRAARAHAEARRDFGLPEVVPASEGGVSCSLCGNGCQMGEGERGFCGLRVNEGGRLRHLAGTPQHGLLHWGTGSGAATTWPSSTAVAPPIASPVRTGTTARWRLRIARR